MQHHMVFQIQTYTSRPGSNSSSTNAFQMFRIRIHTSTLCTPTIIAQTLFFLDSLMYLSDGELLEAKARDVFFLKNIFNQAKHPKII